VQWFAEHMQKEFKRIDMGKPIFNISYLRVKDEIILQEKIDDGKERIFFAGNTPFLLLCRQYVGPYLDLFMAFRDKLPGKIGINATGMEFSEVLLNMYHAMERDKTFQDFLESEGWMDGDFSKYDKKLMIFRFAVHVVWMLVQKTPYYMDSNNTIELNRIKSILRSLQQYVIIIGNDVFLMCKGIPSGVHGTAPLNCVAEAIIEILQFYFVLHLQRYNEPPRFGSFVYAGTKMYKVFEEISLMNYGDDIVKYVPERHRLMYNPDAIRAFSDFIKMDITPARKHEKEIKFKKVTDIMFLKRVPTLYPGLGIIVGKLELSSIARMLAFRDSNEPDWGQMVIDQALRELSFYPPETFEIFLDIFELPAKNQNEILTSVVENTGWLVRNQEDLQKISSPQDYYDEEMSAEPGQQI